MTEKTYDVVVHKANIATLPNESIGEFTSNLSKASCDFVRKSGLVGTTANDYTYMVEAFSDKVVLYASNYASADKSVSKYYALSYKRDSAGVFEFSNAKEVVRVTRFETPASPKLMDSTVISTKKALGADDCWKEASVFKGLI